MSRIGKQQILFSSDIKVNYANNIVTVNGPKGQLSEYINPAINVNISEGVISLKPNTQTPDSNSLWGLYRSLVNNMIIGVKDGFTIELEINGTGYKASVQSNFLVLSLGYSHDIFVEITDSLTVTVKKNIITVTGPSKQIVGQFCAEVRALRKPEPYKGKGVKYTDEVILRKEGKKK